jgi:serine phosphatase RsbU (regulator of sigma subunit)
MKRLTSAVLLLLPLLTIGQSVDDMLQRAIALEYSKPDSAIAITNELLRVKNLDRKVESDIWEVQGIALWVKEDYAKAISAHTRSLELREQIDYKSGVGYSANNLGLNYQRLGDAKLAMENYLFAKDVAIEANDSSLHAKILGNIGTLYEEENDIAKALDFYGQSLAILESLKEDRVLGNTLNNIAVVYLNDGQYAKAKNFAKRSLTVRKLINDDWGVAQSLNLVGLVYANLERYDIADSLYTLSLTSYEQLESPWGQSMVLGNLGNSAIELGNFDAAISYCEQSLELSKTHRLEWEESACKCLAEAQGHLGNSNSSAAYWNRVIAIKDSLRKHNALTEIELVQKRFDFEKERLRAQAEIERQKTLRQAAFGLGMMGLLLFFVAFRSYRAKQKDNELLEEKNSEISEQKEVIEEKNKHITDSIRYAQNLQTAILPKEEMFAKHFTEHHILYKPKDIVSGDFYWMEEANDMVFLAAADCTGHGVPGAMVSMVGFQGLNKAVLEDRLTSPAAILQRLSDHVEEAFEKSGGTVKDGMDICLIAIDKKAKRISYAGAHNALWVLSDQTEIPNAMVREEEDGYRMFELKADRRSIGGYFDAGPFSDKVFELNSGDRLFLFSDGFADQFGGPKGKKMGSKRMRETVRQMALSNNILTLGAIFENWKGEEEQIDDVTLIAVTV